MKKRVLTSHGPGGIIANRTTARTYTHVLWARRAKDGWESYLKGEVLSWEKGIAKYRDIERRLESGEAVRLYNGSSIFYELPDAKRLIARIEDRIASLKARLAAGWEADKDSEWRAISWCGRPDLAAKALAKESKSGYWECAIYGVD